MKVGDRVTTNQWTKDPAFNGVLLELGEHKFASSKAKPEKAGVVKFDDGTTREIPLWRLFISRNLLCKSNR